MGPLHEILGRLVQQALDGAGYRVIDLIGLGNRERVEQAVANWDVDLIWWGASDSG